MNEFRKFSECECKQLTQRKFKTLTKTKLF